jgi:hypothetical protein
MDGACKAYESAFNNPRDLDNINIDFEKYKAFSSYGWI